MSEHLLKAGANITPRDGDELTRLPYLRHWFRTKSAIVLHLSNGTVQINFFQVCTATMATCIIKVSRVYHVLLVHSDHSPCTSWLVWVWIFYQTVQYSLTNVDSVCC